MTHRIPGRRRLAMRGAALTVAAGLSLAALGACSVGGESDASGGSSSHTGKDSSGSKSSDRGGPSAKTPSGSRSGGVPSRRFGPNVTEVPFWKFPTKMKNWKVDYVENEGKFLTKSQKGCYLFAAQQYASGAQGGDQKATQELTSQLLGQLQAGTSNFHAEPSGRTKVHGAKGNDVDGVASMVSYTGNDGKNYRGWYWFRSFTGMTPPLLMRVNYTCPASAYSESELTTILEKGDLAVGGDYTSDFGS